MLKFSKNSVKRISDFCFYMKKQNLHSKVRVRFAPSPTGALHLGGLRTALYNFLYAKNKLGKFLLRIEDTDQNRLVPGALENIIEDLKWAGIEFDEGPIIGGPRGPYIQSERTHIYLDVVEKLLENGSAYCCFCSARRLEMLRKDALRRRLVPRYDNKCRYLTPKEVKEHLDTHTQFCIRFALTDYTEPLQDLVYGPVVNNVSINEGDPVIIKADRYPTYHFANVVDDHLMGITHVFRGVEWQISTTKHILLYKSLGWRPPKYGHLPLLVNADGLKLSKRAKDSSVKYYRDNGYHPEALLNYILSASGGFQEPLFPQGKLNIYLLPELAKKFDIKKMNTSSGRLQHQILDDLNRLQIGNLLEDKVASKILVDNVKDMLKRSYPKDFNLDLDDNHILNILKWSVSRIVVIEDLVSEQMRFLWVKPSEFHLEDVVKKQLLSLIDELETCDFSKANLLVLLKRFPEKEKGVKFPKLMKTLRMILSGLKDGPSVAEMMHLLGKEVVLSRIKEGISKKQRMVN